MKQLLRFIIWLLAMLLIIIIIKTLTFKSLQIDTKAVDLITFGNGSVNHLSKAISFPTISYSTDSPVDTVAFKDYLDFIKDAYPLVNSRLIKEVFNNFSISYTWKGKNISLKPVIFMAHSDVVPVGERSSWEKDPFSGENDGTFIWGRGTLDDKAAMISILEAVEKLLTEGFEPERTIYLSFGHDEEIGGLRGAKTIADTLRERGTIAEYVLDEGMAVTTGMVPMMKRPVALIGTSEKGYLSIKLSVEMPGGHSSTPGKESAIIVLNKALYNLSGNRMKARISGPLNDFIRYLGPELPFYAKAIFANKWLFKGILLKIYQGSSSGNALVRSTAAPSILQAGFKDNVIPAKADAVINFRILPGEVSADVIKYVEKVIGDNRVRIITIPEEITEPSPVSSINEPGFRNILIALNQTYPEAVIAPTLMFGQSDSRHFTEVTRNIYRFAPIFINQEDMARIHGINEMNKIEDFKRGIAFYYRLIKVSN